MASLLPWRVAGSYFESCNCEAICPCRRTGGRKGRRSTYGVCDFALSWWVREGSADSLELSSLYVVMAGTYDDDEPGSPWTVMLYVDEHASREQHHALSEIFLGRAGGTAFENFAFHIADVPAVRSARIELDHTPGRERFRAADWVEVRGVEPVPSAETVTCAIPGHDHPGQEVVTELLRVEDEPLSWEVRGRCGFATDYDYSSSD